MAEDKKPDAVIEVKSAVVDGGIWLRVLKVSVNFDYKPMRITGSGWLSVEPAGTAEFFLPLEEPFDLHSINVILSTLFSEISKATIQVVDAIEKPKRVSSEDF